VANLLFDVYAFAGSAQGRFLLRASVPVLADVFHLHKLAADRIVREAGEPAGTTLNFNDRYYLGEPAILVRLAVD